MDKTTFAERITQVQARVAAATAGPWHPSIEGKHHESGSSCILQPTGGIDLDGASDGDIEFMAHARQDIPYLLTELERLQEVISRSKQ